MATVVRVGADKRYNSELFTKAFDKAFEAEENRKASAADAARMDEFSAFVQDQLNVDKEWRPGETYRRGVASGLTPAEARAQEQQVFAVRHQLTVADPLAETQAINAAERLRLDQTQFADSTQRHIETRNQQFADADLEQIATQKLAGLFEENDPRKKVFETPGLKPGTAVAVAQMMPLPDDPTVEVTAFSSRDGRSVTTMVPRSIIRKGPAAIETWIKAEYGPEWGPLPPEKASIDTTIQVVEFFHPTQGQTKANVPKKIADLGPIAIERWAAEKMGGGWTVNQPAAANYVDTYDEAGGTFRVRVPVTVVQMSEANPLAIEEWAQRQLGRTTVKPPSPQNEPTITEGEKNLRAELSNRGLPHTPENIERARYYKDNQAAAVRETQTLFGKFEGDQYIPFGAIEQTLSGIATQAARQYVFDGMDPSEAALKAKEHAIVLARNGKWLPAETFNDQDQQLWVPTITYMHRNGFTESAIVKYLQEYQEVTDELIAKLNRFDAGQKRITNLNELVDAVIRNKGAFNEYRQFRNDW